MPKLADNPQTEAARKAVAEDKKVSDQSRAEYAERMKGRPTPTQEENDLAAHGAHIIEHDDDGSGPDPFNKAQHTRNLEADRSQGRAQNYQTRSQPAHKTE